MWRFFESHIRVRPEVRSRLCPPPSVVVLFPSVVVSLVLRWDRYVCETLETWPFATSVVLRCRKTALYLYRYSDMFYVCERRARAIEIHIFFSFLFSNLFLAMILSYLITSSGMSGYYVKNNLLEFALSLKTFLFYCTTLTHSLPPIKSIDSFGFTLTAWTAGTRALPWCRSSRLSLELQLRRIHRRQMPFLYLYQIQLSFLVPCFVLHN